MATKTILEGDGSVVFTKQTDQWLKERFEGVIQSISSSGENPHPDDVKFFKAISEEMEKRGL